MSITPLREQTEQKERDTAPQTGQLQQRAVSVVSPPSSSSSSSVPRTIEASNEAFLRNLLAAQPLVGRGQITCLPTAQLNRLNVDQQEMLTRTLALCSRLPRGNDEQTLLEVNRHINTLHDTYNLLFEQQHLRDRFRFRAEDRFDLVYRLAQSYAYQGASDAAIEFLDFSIADMANNFDDHYLPFWDRAISLRAKIRSGPNPLQRIHEINFRSVDMNLKFLVDSGDAFRNIDEVGLAAVYYELALKQQGQAQDRRLQPYAPRPKGLNPLKRTTIHQFLTEFYLSSAALLMPTAPERGIQLYEKALKLESKPEVFKIIFDYYNKQKNDAVSIDRITTRIESLKKMVNLVCSYGDPESSILPKMRHELFQSYLEYARECIKTEQFEKALKLFTRAVDSVERGNCLVDAKTLTALKNEIFKTLVDWSLKLEDRGLTQSALSKIREALEFRKVHLLNIDVAKIEELMKRNEELSKKVKLIQA